MPAETATQPGPFDRPRLRRVLARAGGAHAASFLLERSGSEIAERLADVNRSFSAALALGPHAGSLACSLASSGKVASLVSADPVERLARRAAAPRLVADEERLPFADGAFDLVVSALALHWVNDLPGALIQVRRCLRPDGLFVASLLGGATLQELRAALIAAEAQITGGAAARIAPFAEVRDLGALLQRAGLALPVSDVDRVVVRYAHALDLLADLRLLGLPHGFAAEAVAPLRREVLGRMSEIYAERFSDADGRIRATFEIIYLTGWAPHESQQRPLAPGTARARLADALGAVERSAGEKAPARPTGAARGPSAPDREDSED